MRVLGRASSSNVQAVMWGAAEMGLDLPREDFGGRFGGTDTPEFRALNPNGLVPTLDLGDGTGVFESAAILRYLAQLHGSAPFWPSDPSQRADVDKWAEWGKNTFGRAFTVPIFWAHWRTPESKRDLAAIAAAVRTFESLVGVMPQIADGYVAGESFTMADIWVGHVLYRYFTIDIDRDPPEALTAYYARVAERALFRKHVMIDYSELKAREVN